MKLSEKKSQGKRRHDNRNIVDQSNNQSSDETQKCNNYINFCKSSNQTSVASVKTPMNARRSWRIAIDNFLSILNKSKMDPIGFVVQTNGRKKFSQFLISTAAPPVAGHGCQVGRRKLAVNAIGLCHHCSHHMIHWSIYTNHAALTEPTVLPALPSRWNHVSPSACHEPIVQYLTLFLHFI